MVRGVLTRLIEFIYGSKIVRYLYSFLHRPWYQKEYCNLRKYVPYHREKDLIVLSCNRPYIFEHIKDVYFRLKGHNSFIPLLINPIKSIDRFFINRNYIFSYFQDKYKLNYNKDVFSYTYLPLIHPKALIESIVTTYSDLCRAPIKILYAHSLFSLGFIKDSRCIRYIHKYTHLFLTGPSQKKAILLAHKLYGGKLPKMVEVGFLRGDRLLTKKKEFNKEFFLKNLLLEEKFTVLFAPTWGIFSATKEWIDEVVKICRELDLNLFIKLHPFMYSGKTKWKTGGVNWSVKLRNIVKENKNVYVVDDDNIDDFLIASDVVITDVSSVCMEGMIIEKPVIFLSCPQFFELYREQKYMMRIRKELEVTKPEELKQTLLKYMKGGACYMPSLKEVIYNPGNALDVFVSYLENL